MHKYVHLSHFRHDWIEQKVKQPYVYFLGKVINRYEQELRMPWFDFSDKDAARITTFIMGQTGKPPHEEYRYDPLGSEATRQWLRAKGRDPDAVAAILAGRKEIERRNCTGCHKIGVGWQYVEVGEFDLAADKENYWLEGALVAHFDPNLPEGRYTKVSQGKEVTEGDKVVVPAGGWVDADVMFGEDDFFAVAYEVLGKEPVQVDVGAGDEIRVELQRPDRIKVNGIGEGYIARFYDDFSMAPPIILNNGAKTRPEWFFKWLKNITPVRNHIEVRMPQFKWTDEEATTVVHAFSAMAGEPFPYETEEIRPLSEIHRKTAREIFGIPGTDEYSGSLSCFSCHPAGELVPGGDKSSWGPNLYLTRDRLQVDFVKSWLRLPKKWMPGTRMTAYFYDEDLGELIANDPPVTPAVAEIGNDEAIVRLAEMLYYLPLMEDVAQALAAEVERLKNAPPPEEDAADVFDEDEEMDDEEEDFEGEDEEDAEEFFDEDEDEDEDPSL